MRAPVSSGVPRHEERAGYDAEVVGILNGPVATSGFALPAWLPLDGSLIVADWYDPGVGGHNMGPRVDFSGCPDGHQYQSPKVGVSKIDGAVVTLKSPNQATRYLAWHALRKLGKKAEPLASFGLIPTDHRARALWILGKIAGGDPIT